MKLYHFTNIFHLGEILSDKEIKLTDSNLLTPTSPYKDATSLYKPVAWFNKDLSFSAAEKSLGVKFYKVPLEFDKSIVAIEIETDTLKQEFHLWSKWATDNHIAEAWFNRLKATASSWETFYITEQPVQINSSVKIHFNPQKITKEVKPTYTLEEFLNS